MGPLKVLNDTNLVLNDCSPGVVAILTLSGNAGNTASFKSADYPLGLFPPFNAVSSVVIGLSRNKQCIFNR